VGDYVLAIGNPLGLGQTVTMGIVSAKNRVIGEKLGDIDPRYEDFIQTDAAINQGNSGGPLFNFRGEVIAINAAIINPGVAMNVGFAIPINLARQIADQIRQVREGRARLPRRQRRGLHARARRRDADAVRAGALINAVGRGTPAAAAGCGPTTSSSSARARRSTATAGCWRRSRLLRPGEKAKLVLSRQGSASRRR
jgi:serine protease Do